MYISNRIASTSISFDFGASRSKLLLLSPETWVVIDGRCGRVSGVPSGVPSESGGEYGDSDFTLIEDTNSN